MTRYFLVKSGQFILLIAGICIISFTLVSLSPIDPVRAYIGDNMMRMSPDQVELISARWGLNDPAPIRFFKWMGQILQGNMGTSLIFNKPVSQVIGERFLLSFWLMLAAWLLSGIIGYVLGVIAGAMRGSLVDQVIRFYAYIMATTPAFWLGMILLIIFSVWWRVTPICCAGPPGVPLESIGFWQRLHHLILPALTLSIIGVANITLHTRQKLLEALQSEYALFAFAQGETVWGVVWHHGLRNISLPAITLQFASLSELFGGIILAEKVFTYPGLGEATVQAGLRSDVPLLLGIVLFSATFVFIGNTTADIIYRFVDPRIRIGDNDD